MTTITTPEAPATDAQLAFILRLSEQRVLEPGDDSLLDMLLDPQDDRVPRTKKMASAAIEMLQTRARKPSTNGASVTEPGVHETPAGEIFVVKPNREKTRLYAKRLVEINGQRATEAGERVEIEFEYAAGAIFKLSPDMKMPLERAKALTIRYGRCIVCNRHLKAAQSVEQGIGPVCRKSFS